jgi:hypothetical protein
MLQRFEFLYKTPIERIYTNRHTTMIRALVGSIYLKTKRPIDNQ